MDERFSANSAKRNHRQLNLEKHLPEMYDGRFRDVFVWRQVLESISTIVSEHENIIMHLRAMYYTRASQEGMIYYMW